MALSAEALREAERESRRLGTHTEDTLNARADAVNAVRGLIKSARTERAQHKLAMLILKFVEELADTVDTDPSRLARATTAADLMAVVNGTSTAPAALGSGTGSDSSADPAPAKAAMPPQVEAMLNVLADLSRKFGYGDDVVAFLTTGPIAVLAHIADRGGDSPNAVSKLLGTVYRASSPTDPYALQADGSLMVESMLETAENELRLANRQAQTQKEGYERQLADLTRRLERLRPIEDALRGLTDTQVTDRTPGMVTAARGGANPSVDAANRRATQADERFIAVARALDLQELRTRGLRGENVDVWVLNPEKLDEPTNNAIIAARKSASA